MNLVCPVCESKFTFEQACRDQLFRDFIGLASFYSRSWGLVNEYADCFRIARNRLLPMKKRKRVLDELRTIFEKSEFVFDGKRYRVTQQSLVEGLKIVVNSEKHGFQNHNYLKMVLINNQAERVSAEGLTAAEERKQEQQRRAGRSVSGRRGDRRSPTLETENLLPPVGGAGFKPALPITAAEYKKQKGIQSLAATICKDIPEDR